MMKPKMLPALLILLVTRTAACGKSSDAAKSGIEAGIERHSGASSPGRVPSLFEKDVSGTYGRTCVNVNHYLDDMGRVGAARSGDFVAGNFPAYVAQEKPNPRYDKIWWAPLHTGEMPGVRVKATRLDEPSVSRAYRSSSVAGNEALFYPSNISLPRTGTWQLIATSDPDRGCFELTLPG